MYERNTQGIQGRQRPKSTVRETDADWAGSGPVQWDLFADARDMPGDTAQAQLADNFVRFEQKPVSRPTYSPICCNP